MEKSKKGEIALFRYSIIHDFVNDGRLDHGQKEKLLRQKTDRTWRIPHSGRTRISRAVILKWIADYEQSGRKLGSLEPRQRNDRGQARALDDETALNLIGLRKELMAMPVPLLLETAVKRGLIGAQAQPGLTTLYRFLHEHNLMKPEGSAPPQDRRKFEAELPNDIWQSDVLHGPELRMGDKTRKSYLIAFIDDHSRLVPHGEFYCSESLNCFLDAFRQAMLKRGVPRKLYVDNGAAYRSRQLEYICANLGIALIHARPYTPQGKGKIERFFKTVRGQFLSGFRGSTLTDINLAFECWLRDDYHRRKHTATGQPPLARFAAGMQCVRSAPADLSDYFRTVVRRRVNRDRTVIIDRRLYEAPVELIGKKVEVLFHEKSPEQAEVKWQNKSFGLLGIVDLQINCRVKRDKNRQVQLHSDDCRPESGKLWGDRS
jgi:transposase InsO family protein